MSSYQPGIPTGTVNLDIDYQNIQNNFLQANTSMGVDHTAFDTNTINNPAGYHKAIHSIPISTAVTNPPNNQPINGYTATAGFGQVLSANINDGINTDEALFWLTGGNRLMQLTRNFVPTNSQNGASYLPGGLILNWGYFNSTGGAGQVVTLTQPFPKNFYNAQATMNRNSSNVDVIYCQTAPAAGAFTQLTFRDTSSGNPFFWYAIGN